MNLRAIFSRLPLGQANSRRLYDAGTVQVAERVIDPTPIPQRGEAPKSSEYAGSYFPAHARSPVAPVGPREKVRYVIEPEDLGLVPGRALRMANTLIGASFFAPSGSRRRALEAQAGYRMESRPRYTKVHRYPRPARTPGVYGRG